MYGLHGEAACGCKAGASLWIEAWFGDCVYSSWELTSFYLGLSSLLFWLVAQVPQLISNWHLRSAEALSPWFLFQWLAVRISVFVTLFLSLFVADNGFSMYGILKGDTFNFLGCLLTGDQLAIQNLSASYFMFADFIVISQYMYYQKPHDQEEVLLSKYEDSKRSTLEGSVVVCSPSPVPSDSGRVRDIGNEEEQQLKGWQKHLAKYQRGEATPLLLNQAWDEKSSEFESPNARPSHTSSSLSMNRQLRRVIMQYGLEYGPPTGPLLRIHHGPRRKHGTSVRRAAVAAVVSLVGLVCLGSASHGVTMGNQFAVSTMGLAVGRKLLTICKDPRTPWMKNFGTVIGWSSASLYVGSRISQVVKNNDRRSVEGLSLAMIFCAIGANFTYGISICMRLYSWQGFIAKAPWLVGSLGTVSLDIIILLQAHYLTHYAHSREDKLSEYTPLLV